MVLFIAQRLRYIISVFRNVFKHGKSSVWGDISAGVPQGSILGPFFFLVYINDLTENLKCNVKLFADDTSLFNVVQNPNAAANDMNHDLEAKKQWAHHWRMSFNPDPQRQAVEIIFSRKRNKIDHPVILFNGTPVKKVDEHKHLGLFLDSKLSFHFFLFFHFQFFRHGSPSVKEKLFYRGPCI